MPTPPLLYIALPKLIRSQFRYAKNPPISLGKQKSRANAVSDHTPAAGSGGGVAVARAPHRLLLARGGAACAGGAGGARGAELRLYPEAGALQLQPQHPRRVPEAGQAPRPAHQGPDHRYAELGGCTALASLLPVPDLFF